MASAIQVNAASFGHELNMSGSGEPKTMNNTKVAVDFQKELNSVLQTRPPISKEKMNQIVNEAIKAIRNYKHVVYYVETFIKNV